MVELTILMPCLNEEETLRVCIQKAKQFLIKNHVDGEILIADNGSTDDSTNIAHSENVRVISVKERGYGSALIAGCNAAFGKYVIMGDADDSYDFLHLYPFLRKLREGYDLVMGDRFSGGIENGAMPWSHRYIGNPILSFIGRLFFRSKVRDFHCGLRGYNRNSITELNLHTSGMEYASEMVVSAHLHGLKIAEVPTTLKKDGRSKAPHLRSFRDGWRHLKFLFMYAPNWLFFYPGLAMITISAVLGSILVFKELTINDVVLSIHTLLFCAIFLMIGINMLLMFVLTKTYAIHHDFIPFKKNDLICRLREDRFIAAGAIITFLGVLLSIISFLKWQSEGFSDLIPEVMMRWVIPAVTALEVGTMLILTGFFMGIIKSELLGNK
ncbi:MAG: glycosyltransferase family 2 protein [Lachnospiraceae bacterium]|nr:glycosyltransferase family 2 protein [Lachnospiraceae bacterium]